MKTWTLSLMLVSFAAFGENRFIRNQYGGYGYDGGNGANVVGGANFGRLPHDGNAVPSPPSIQFPPGHVEQPVREPALMMFFKSFQCEWVKSPDDPEPVETVVGMKLLNGCEQGYAQKKPETICTGTTKCHVQIKGKNKPVTSDLFFENTMCISTSEKCPDATQCAKDGGILDEVAADVRNSGPGLESKVCS